MSSNIESGWLKTGLKPQDPGQISKQLVKPKAQNQSITFSKIPEISQIIKRGLKELTKETSDSILILEAQSLILLVYQLEAQNSLLKHENQGL